MSVQTTREMRASTWVDDALNQALALRALATIRSTLALTHDDIAAMLSCETGETINESMVRGWETKLADLPPGIANQLVIDERYCEILRGLYRPHRLPAVLRRPAPIFDQRTALSWIRSGRLRDVAEAYDHALRFQA